MSDPLQASEKLIPTRIETGIARLDYILNGGFFLGNIYTVVGPPGSGKTIMANQICFHQIRSNPAVRCVYMTLLVESHAKMLLHLSSLRYFDAQYIPERLYYVSGYPVLRSDSFPALLDLIRRTLKEHRATVFVLDGLESAEQCAPDLRSFREFINELQGITSVLGCVTFLLTTARGRESVEHSLVDGIIELSDQLVGPRAVRELTVHKFRGSEYLRGRHEVEIESRGMVVHPRTEIRFDSPPQQATEERVRMPFGIDKLDEMLFGGIPSGSSVALLGAPGAGKTMIGLTYLVEGAKRGQHGTYFGFYEPPPRLCEKAAQIGVPLREYVEKGLIDLIWQPPLEHMMDALTEELLEHIKENVKPRRRLFIDGIEGFRAAAVYTDRMPRFLSALTNQLRALDVTTLISEELELFKPEVSIPNPELANVVESVILLRYVELRSQLYRLMSIMKMRESRYDTAIREFRITSRGVQVAGSFESAEAILTGHARTTAAGQASPTQWSLGDQDGHHGAEPSRGRDDPEERT